MKKTNKRGFTLIELIVVIAILAVLALILVPNVSSYMDKAKQAVADANARTCYSGAIAEQAVNPSLDAGALGEAARNMLIKSGDTNATCKVTLNGTIVESVTYSGVNGTGTFPKN